MQPLYNIQKTFLENLEDGPQFCGALADRKIPPAHQWGTFLGYPVMSPIGVAACAVTTSKGISLLAQLGFDILTYKTIRCAPHQAHGLPNILLLDAQQARDALNQGKPLVVGDTKNTADLALANSFGNAGPGAEFFYTDIQQAKKALRAGQVLLVSVYGAGSTAAELTQDFVAAAQLAASAGADVIEVNLSCPNIGDGKTMLYHDADMVHHLIKNIVNRVTIPVIAKVGVVKDNTILTQLLRALARAGARGVCGINSVPMIILAPDGTPAFGCAARATSGVCGAPIRELALDFVRRTRIIIDTEKLGLAIAGVGGVTQPEHFTALLNAGADVALSASGMMFNPYLAHEFHNSVCCAPYTRCDSACDVIR